MEQSSPTSPKAKPFKPNFEQEETFQNLIAFFQDRDENDLSAAVSDPETVTNLQQLLNSFFTTICDTFIENRINQKVFELAKNCLVCITDRDDVNHSESSANSEFKQEQINQKQLITETSQKVINRIAKQLKIKTPVTEPVLVETINQRIHKYKDCFQEIVDSFDLGPNTRPNAIVPLLKTKLNLNNSESVSVNESTSKSVVKSNLKQQLFDVTKELSNAQHQLQKKENEIATKDTQIKELKDSINDLKSKNQNASLIQEMNKDLIDKRVKFGKLSSENKSLKKENDNLTKRCQALELKLDKYKQQVIRDKEVNTQLIEKLSQTKTQMKQHQKEADNTSLETIRQHDQQQSKQFGTFIDQLTQQYENQAEELVNESELRKSVVESIFKLYIVNQELEKQLETSQQKVEELTKQAEAHDQTSDYNGAADTSAIDNQEENNNENEDQQARIKQNKSRDINLETVDEGLVETLHELVDSINSDSKEPILKIIDNNNQSISDRVARSVNSLVNFINDTIQTVDENEESKARYQLLLNTVGSVLTYLNNLIDTGEITRFTMNNHGFDEARSLLSTQVSRITCFIKENCGGNIEDESMASAFLRFKDPTQLQQYLQEYLEKYPEEENNNEKESELLILLLQSISAGIVLHTYALQAKGQVEKQSQDLKSMKKEAKKQQKRDQQNEKELTSAQEKVQRADQTIKEVKATLRKFVIESDEKNCDPNLILDQLEKVDKADAENQEQQEQPQGEEYPDNQYISDLQAKLKNLQSRVQEQDANLETLNNEVTKANDDKENELKSTQQNYQDQINQLNTEIKKLRSKNQKLINRQRQLNDTALQTISSEMIIQDENPEIEQYKKDIDRLTQDNHRLNNEKEQLYQKVEDINNRAVEKLNKLKQSLKNSKAKIEEEYEKKKEEYRATIAQNEAVISDLENEVQLAKQSENETKEDVNNLHKELNIITERFETIQAQLRIAKSRLIGKEEEIKREKASFDAQFRLKQFASQTEAQAQIDAYRYEYTTRTNDFLMSVCQLFNDYCDPNQKIDYDSVLEMLQRVSTIVEKNTNDNQNAAKELEAVRKQLGLKKSAKLSDNVRELQAQNNQLNRQVQEMETEKKKSESQEEDQNNENSDWASWATSLYNNALKKDGFDNDKQNDKDVQKAIEDAVLSAAGNPRQTRQLAILRNEKKLLINGSTKVNIKNPKLSMSQMMVVAIAIKRLLKMSGHQQSEIALSIQPDEEEQKTRRSGNPNQKQVKPLFKQFVRPRSE